MEIELSYEGANALRILADNIPAAFNRISEKTDQLLSLCSSLSSDLGVHADDFKELLLSIKQRVNTAEEKASYLPPKMRETADRIDEYVRHSLQG